MTAETTAWRPGTIAQRILPDGRELCIYPQLFTHKLVVGLPGEPCYDDAWCYNTQSAALKAWATWDGAGEPEGWHRHPASGRRRAGGDPATEVVRP
jgi:hypothetical protein